MGVNLKEPSFSRLMLGVHLGAMFPVVALAVIFYPLSAFVILLGVPLALAAVWMFILPLISFLALRTGLRLWHVIVIGALAAAGPHLLLRANLIFASITGWPAKTGLTESNIGGTWRVKNGMLTEAGWWGIIVEPLLVLVPLGIIGALIGLWISFGSLRSRQWPRSS